MISLFGFNPAEAASDSGWENFKSNQKKNTARRKEAQALAKESGNPYFSWVNTDGSVGRTRTDSPFGESTITTTRAVSSNNTGLGNSSNGVGGASSLSSLGNSNNSFLSSLGFGEGNSLFDTAKDMARFRLGLDQEQAQFFRGLREQEAQSNFGRNTKLAAQQITGQQDLENIRQTGATERIDKEIAGRRDLLDAGNNFNLLVLGKNRAAALRGLR